LQERTELSGGSDFFGAGGLIRLAVRAMNEFEMPEELQQRYGFAPVTTSSEKEDIR